MDDGTVEFERLVGAVLQRWLGQNGGAPLDEVDLSGFVSRLWLLVTERGLPRPLVPEEVGAPGGIQEAEASRLVARVTGDLAEPLVIDAARQFVKTCFYPEFRNCRNSFREKASHGVCRRQQLSRVRGRISGSHCVDCPHWVTLPAPEHEKYLAAEWCSDAAEFRAHREVFLPEDFRRLRQWLHARARQTGA